MVKKKAAKDETDKIIDAAKNKDNKHSDSENISREIDTIYKTFGTDIIFSGFVSVLQK